MEKIWETSLEPDVQRSGLDYREDDIKDRGWLRQPASRLSRKLPWLLTQEASGGSSSELKFWKISCPHLADMAHCLSCPGGTLLQEDIHLRELEDKHWLCNAGADRHVRQVSERSCPPCPPSSPTSQLHRWSHVRSEPCPKGASDQDRTQRPK